MSLINANLGNTHYIIYMKAGIYIHIPFCESRCIYCGFYSTTANQLRHRYVDCILKEINLRKEELKQFNQQESPCTIDTIYIGGGTPSVLPAEEIVRILSNVRSTFLVNVRETTMEVNPDDITPQMIADVKAAGVNRISIGIQTFDEERLRFIHRRHTAEQAIKAVDIVRMAGIENISIDLMFGFPGETIEDWRTDIDTTLKLNPSHISAYCLMYEEGTPLYKMLGEGKVKQIDDDTYLAMYTELMDKLSHSGYEHYEISNFARPGCRSIHNSSYWHDVPYLGFGASAHSYLMNTRSWNVANLKKYIESIEKGVRTYGKELIDGDTHYNDLVTTALRTREGLDLNTIGEPYRIYAMNNATEGISNGLLEIVDNHLRLTRKGLFVSDGVMSDLVKV